jgi:hypothetical protein
MLSKTLWGLGVTEEGSHAGNCHVFLNLGVWKPVTDFSTMLICITKYMYYLCFSQKHRLFVFQIVQVWGCLSTPAEESMCE